MIEIITGIISGLIATAIVSGIVFWRRRLILKRRHSFITQALGNTSTIQIVVSSLYIEKFKFLHDSKDMVHNSPPNVLFMPFNEGHAIAILSNVIKKIYRNIKIKLVLPEQYDSSLPAIVVGGPSVNTLSARILGQDFPDFSINYPEARKAAFKGWSFQTAYDDKSGFIKTDYGFVFSSLSPNDKRCFIVCGVLAFGTAVAVDYLVDLDAKSQEGIKILEKKKSFIAIEGIVDHFEVKQSGSIGVYEEV